MPEPLAERHGKLAVAGMPRQFVFKLQAEYSIMPAFTRTIRRDPSWTPKATRSFSRCHTGLTAW